MSGRETGYTWAKLVTISGDNGSAGSTKTNFKVFLGPNFQKITRISIPSVTFPNNAYNVNAMGGGANNTFSIEEGTTEVDFSLTGGYYTTSQLMSAVQTAINSHFTTEGKGQSIALSQDPISQLVSFTYTPGTGAATITLQNESGTTFGIWGLLGWQTLPVTGSSGVADSLPSLGGLKEVYLQSNALAPGNMYDKDGAQKNTLLAIPITAPFGVSNVFECKVDSLCEITYPTPRNLTEVDFSLTDKLGNIVDLHGGNLVINLKVWFNRY